MGGANVCSVAQCSSNSKKPNPDGKKITFFTFLKHPNISKEWARKCYHKDKWTPMNKKICSKHFLLTDFEDELQARLMNFQPMHLKKDDSPALQEHLHKGTNIVEDRVKMQAARYKMETDTWIIKNVVTEEIRYISKSIFKVGRNVNADLTSLTNSLSRNHATFSILIDGLLYLQDNNSCNGTYVNNEKIPPMELILVKEGDVVGFGCCQQLCKDQNFETPPLIFTVLKKTSELSENKQAENQTVKNQFSSVSDCILISDDEDDEEIFGNSQIFKISEKIKSEQTNFKESVDPYYNIKQELEDLDYCDNNQYVVDLTDEEKCFEKTSDLLNILESPVQKHTQKNLEAECVNGTTSKQKYSKPPIIEPHFKDVKKAKIDLKPNRSKSKDHSDGVANIKSTSKRKSTVLSPHAKKKSKSVNNLTETRYDKKSIEEEFHKRSKSKTPPDKNTNKSQNKTLLEERKKKLKEINRPSNSENVHVSNIKTVKHAPPKVKNSASRGTFLLKGSSNTHMKNSPEPLPSTSKCTTGNTMQVEDQKIQDTTITSNFSPTTDTDKPQKINMPVKKTSDVEKPQNIIIPNKRASADLQEPESTFNENRSGLIWQTASNFARNPAQRNFKNVTIDDFISKMVHWSAKWLVEQNNMDISPPVNGEIRPKEMPLNFASFLEYFDTVTALTLLELWQYVYQTLYNQDEERTPIRLFLNHTRIVGKLSYLDCECYLTETNIRSNTIPRVDDFGLIELKLKDSNYCYVYTGFAYIKGCKRKYVNNSLIDSNVAALCSGIPNISLSLNIVTRNLAYKEIIGKQVILKVIANISSPLRLLKSIKYLEVSPLCKNILCPKIEDFKVPSATQNVAVEVNLNNEQRQIVLEACNVCLGNTPKLYLIKGPPGTGKSTVIINIVLQILLNDVRGGNKEPPLILLTAPSNTAVDGLVLKLGEIRKKLTETQRRHIKMVRMGPESSISANVDKFKLSTLAQKHILKEQRLTSLDTYKEVLKRGLDVNDFLKRHLGHNYYYEMKCSEEVLLFGSNIICTTLSSCVSSRIFEARRRDKLKFSCCIIDEATQCTEAESLLPLQLGIGKVVLVGDPQQLPAVVCNKDAQRLGYAKSLFARIDDNFRSSLNNPVRMLCEQYRMKQEICEYPNKTFYNGKLKSLPIHINKIVPELRPYLLFNLVNTENEDESHYINSQEVRLILNLLETLRKCIQINCRYSIGIITPYKAQKELLLRHMTKIKFNNKVTITVNTVDSFQGMENDVVIISCVRYSPNYFLQNEHRLNVALTRARQALYIIGNYSLFKHCQPLYDLREDAKKRRLCVDIQEISRNIDFSKYIFKV